MIERGAMSSTLSIPVYCLKLAKERTIRVTERVIADPNTAARVVARMVGDADREVLVAVFLNAECQILGTHQIAMGTLDGARTTGREVFKCAIVMNAHALILGHNHPSGSLEPSETDIAMTRRLMMLGRMLAIPILDHVVVSFRGFRSMREMGIVPTAQQAERSENFLNCAGS